MIVRRFLRFLKTASAHERAAGAHALARAYLVSPLSAQELAEAEAAMTLLLDDPSPDVRLALAEALAAEARAPRHVVDALASDQPQIAELVLRFSPLLIDAALVDRVATGGTRVQCAVAERRPVSPPVAAAIAEVGEPDACAALLENATARIAPFSLSRIAERHGENALVRDLLLSREDLPLSLRRRLVADLTGVLADFVVGRAWLGADRARDMARDALDRATLTLAETDDQDGLEELVAHLISGRHLTSVLALRALCTGNLPFLEEAIAQLAGLPRARVAGIVHARSPQAFHALYRRAGLPEAAYPAFQAAVDVVLDTEIPDRPDGRSRHARQVLERILTRYERFSSDESDHLLLLLRRYADEAARDEARRYADALGAEPEITPQIAA
jgi:uncharacterized protein (DUF2336 family)